MKVDRGNPNSGNIGADFNRLGLEFWQRIRAADQHSTTRIAHLAKMAQWRNAIAHQDFDPQKLGDTINLQLAMVRQWRRACEGLATTFDLVIAEHILQITGTSPW